MAAHSRTHNASFCESSFAYTEGWCALGDFSSVTLSHRTDQPLPQVIGQTGPTDTPLPNLRSPSPYAAGRVRIDLPEGVHWWSANLQSTFDELRDAVTEGPILTRGFDNGDDQIRWF